MTTETIEQQELAAMASLAERFPELRRGCTGSNCCSCGPDDWEPIPAAEALYWLMGQRGFRAVYVCPDGFLASWEGFPDYGEGPTPLLALAAAVEAASPDTGPDE